MNMLPSPALSERVFLFISACSIAVASMAATVSAAELVNPSDQTVLLTADHIVHDQATGIVTASGHVEIVQDQRILRADEVRYDANRDSVFAVGNVVLLEPSGDVMFAESTELSDQMRNGTIMGFRGLLSDNSRIAANAAQRKDGNKTVMTKAVYSPCNLCAEHPERAPLWQIKAVTVEHNQAAKRIDYKDAILEVYGIPVAYTPFFSHPDPSVKRKSGFLPPSFGSSSELGKTVQIPYFYVISPDKDVTFSPKFTTEEGAVLMGEYRQRTERGSYQFDASATYPEGRDQYNQKTGSKDARWHVRGNGQFNIDDTWRWGFDAFRSSDDTYLRRYDISNETTLTSDLYVEGFRGRNYAAAHAWSFQHLTEEINGGETTLVVPLLEYSHVGEPGHYGDRISADASLLVLQRRDGVDTRRLSVGTGWHLPYVGPLGDLYSFDATIRGDLYYVNAAPDVASPWAQNNSGVDGRIWPTLSLEWRYPWARSDGNIRQVIEPIVQGVVAPNGGNSSSIPNEDSRSFEFDDTNLFSDERYPGLDRVEGGARINYGLKASVYGHHGYSSALFGQTYRFKSDDTFETNTGLGSNFSDYVGRIIVSPGPYLEFTHRFRLSRETLDLKRNEISLSGGPQRVRVGATYIKLMDELATDNLVAREELYLRARVQLSEHWAINAFDRIDLSGEKNTLLYGGGLTYADECVELRFFYNRSFTRDRDVPPSTFIGFQIQLKNLG